MNVPDGWKLNTVGELFDVQLGKMLNQAATEKKPQFKYLGNTNVKWGYFELSELKTMFFSEKEKEKFTLRNGDIVMCEGGEVGRCAIWKYGTVDIFYQKALHRLRPKGEVRPEFFQNYMKYIVGTKLLDDFTSRTSIAHLTREKLLELPIKVPTLPEQQKIAQILSIWDKAIEKLEALIAAKQKRKKALMQQLLTGKKRFAEFVKSDGMQKTKFGTIPTDWQYLHIAEVAKQLSVKNHAGHDLPVLSCTKHYGLVDSLTYFGRQIFSEDTSTYKVAPRNTFAYATNHIEEGSIGYQNLYDEALISPMYTVFQTKKNINDEFLFRVLKTELYRHIFEVNTSASVDRRGSLRWNQFAAIKIPVPSIPEQEKIASFFAVADKEIETNQRQLSALKDQKKGLMQQLLTGKRRAIIKTEI
jgi:type I restriction enzyme S subunit